MPEEIIGWKLAGLALENHFGHLQRMGICKHHPVELVSRELLFGHIMDESPQKVIVGGERHFVLEVHVPVEQV